MRTYDAIVNYGIKKLFEPSRGIMNFMRNMYDWYYDINEKYEFIVGDFNPKDNSKVKLMRNKLDSSDYKMYPETEENTTKKIRSGYCAQYKKFWKKSLVCKDLCITKNDILMNYTVIFPKTEELLTNKWLGDHSALINQVYL